MAISHVTRQLVRERAEARCEYCRIPEEEFAAATWFVVEHIQPRAKFEECDPERDAPENLAWACPKCNGSKLKRTEAPDPETGDVYRLFNPRRDTWDDHFVGLPGGRIEGITPMGRSTRQALKFDEPDRVKSRYILVEREKWP